MRRNDFRVSESSQPLKWIAEFTVHFKKITLRDRDRRAYQDEASTKERRFGRSPWPGKDFHSNMGELSLWHYTR
jgi:hypothetical protein